MRYKDYINKNKKKFIITLFISLFLIMGYYPHSVLAMKEGEGDEEENKEIVEVEKEKQGKSEEVQAAEEAVKKANENLVARRNSLGEIEKKEKELKLNQNIKKQVEKATSELYKKIEELKTELLTKQDGHKEEVSKLNKQIEELRTELASQNGKVEELTSQIKDLRSEIENQKQEVGRLNNLIEDLSKSKERREKRKNSGSPRYRVREEKGSSSYRHHREEREEKGRDSYGHYRERREEKGSSSPRHHRERSKEKGSSSYRPRERSKEKGSSSYRPRERSKEKSSSSYRNIEKSTDKDRSRRTDRDSNIIVASTDSLEENLTSKALQEERKSGRYVSPQGLIYMPKKKVKSRVEHITKHLKDDLNKKKHTFFNPYTKAYKDIIGFIDVIFGQFLTNGVNLKNSNLASSTPVGEILLEGKNYQVFDSYDVDNQHSYDILPAGIGDYPNTGTDGKGSQTRGYRFVLKYDDSSGNPVIETFFPV